MVRGVSWGCAGGGRQESGEEDWEGVEAWWGSWRAWEEGCAWELGGGGSRRGEAEVGKV